MGKINSPVQNLSLRKSLILYVTAFAVLAIVLSAMTVHICDNAVNGIYSSYPPSGEKYYLTNERGEQLGNGGYIGTTPFQLSEQDELAVAALNIFTVIASPVYSALCITAAALMFYRNKLKKPLAELQAASEKISNNNLDFSIEYDSKDEMGQLCSSFEIMRTALVRNFTEIWRQAEGRKQLNAAFAHNLRTPLTVLKGYNEMLRSSEDILTRETAATMEKHISRMESYVSSMSNLQCMEDAQPECEYIFLQPLISSLYESASIVCTQKGKTLLFENKVHVLQLNLDSSFISQVCDNLLSNAARYARSTVTLSFALKEGGLLLSVSDDGKGFGESGLRKAAEPYFTGEINCAEHFGLGLYICKLLCEHHGGCLKIENAQKGARVSAFFKAPLM